VIVSTLDTAAAGCGSSSFGVFRGAVLVIEIARIGEREAANSLMTRSGVTSMHAVRLEMPTATASTMRGFARVPQ
jgi:hypothetical protein